MSLNGDSGFSGDTCSDNPRSNAVPTAGVPETALMTLGQKWLLWQGQAADRAHVPARGKDPGRSRSSCASETSEAAAELTSPHYLILNREWRFRIRQRSRATKPCRRMLHTMGKYLGTYNTVLQI